MEYDSRPSGSSVSPLIIAVATIVALVCVSAVVYFVVLAPSSQQSGQNAATSAGLADNQAVQDGSGQGAGSSQAGDVGLDPADWRRGFRTFQQNHTTVALANPLASVDSDEPASFVRLYDGDITPAPGHEGYGGIVSLYVTPSGRKVLRLHQNLDLKPTPGLTMTLTSSPNIRAIGDLRTPYVTTQEVGGLDQFTGETHFVVPQSLPADALQSVAFWSKPYDVLVATAVLAPY